MKKIVCSVLKIVFVLSLCLTMGCGEGEPAGPGEGIGNFGGPSFPEEELVYLGESFQGGILAYVDATGEHGLIATPEDLSPGIQWYNGSSIVTGATGTMVGTGKSNTSKIVLAQGEGNYAAKLCDDLVLGGYDDWYLPSLNELDILYRNRDKIGLLYPANYWSSSESTIYWARYMNFRNGTQTEADKNGSYRVRAVRAF